MKKKVKISKSQWKIIGKKAGWDKNIEKQAQGTQNPFQQLYQMGINDFSASAKDPKVAGMKNKLATALNHLLTIVNGTDASKLATISASIKNINMYAGGLQNAMNTWASGVIQQQQDYSRIIRQAPQGQAPQGQAPQGQAPQGQAPQVAPSLQQGWNAALQRGQ